MVENPENICVDGTKTRKSSRQLDPYREQILEMIERGFKTSQILVKLREANPSISVKRTTLSDFCVNLRMELFDYSESTEEIIETINDESILAPYTETIGKMLAESKPMTVILAVIKDEGYPGSYSLLQQYCLTVKPTIYITKKSVRKVKRRDLVTAIWSGAADLSDEDLSYIDANYPIVQQIKIIITEFRTFYAKKDVDAVRAWCENYANCKFPAIRSFINGINVDADAFYNSMRYHYSNGLLEGFVNKVKAVKRSMYGRAGYLLLRAKLLLTNRA